MVMTRSDMHLPTRSPLSSCRRALGLSLVLLLQACVVVHEGVDRPAILDVDAFCDDLGYFELWAEVAHDDGPRAVVSVWVDVSYVFYDEWDIIELDYWGSIDLEYTAEGQWSIVLPPGDVLLDCDYPYEYHFSFFAEDQEGDLSSTDLIN
ncbi:MAG: hypothetical protein CL558_06155 [Alphaproteobacteria bacterium]|nr:hypothetical protein [Alphaproteobacteria bacterium]HCP47421.1 hypothetical protein [Deltaproteobacteria bacterium]|tara:strand:+ start:454 stop:903 length:450 start_codon:yes stop_codon:yes gene_type:complete